jgi:hypothetical protein
MAVELNTYLLASRPLDEEHPGGRAVIPETLPDLCARDVKRLPFILVEIFADSLAARPGRPNGTHLIRP